MIRSITNNLIGSLTLFPAALLCSSAVYRVEQFGLQNTKLDPGLD